MYDMTPAQRKCLARRSLKVIMDFTKSEAVAALGMASSSVAVQGAMMSEVRNFLNEEMGMTIVE